jgi:hypothetical protein
VHFVNSCGEREEDISEDDDDDVLVVMLCKLVARDQGLSPEDGGTFFLRYGW